METMETIELSEILEQIAAGRLSLEEAIEAAAWLSAAPPPDLTCATCRFFDPAQFSGVNSAERQGLCMCQPEHIEHEQSIRCYRYEQRDERFEAFVVIETGGDCRRRAELAAATGTSQRAWL